MKTNSIKIQDKAQIKEVAQAFSSAITLAMEKVNFDLRCIDWCSYNPDFHIKKQDIKVA